MHYSFWVLKMQWNMKCKLIHLAVALCPPKVWSKCTLLLKNRKKKFFFSMTTQGRIQSESQSKTILNTVGLFLAPAIFTWYCTSEIIIFFDRTKMLWCGKLSLTNTIHRNQRFFPPKNAGKSSDWQQTIANKGEYIIE